AELSGRRGSDALFPSGRRARAGKTRTADAVLPDPAPLGILRAGAPGPAGPDEADPPPAAAGAILPLVLAVSHRRRLPPAHQAAGGGVALPPPGALVLPPTVPGHDRPGLPGGGPQSERPGDGTRAVSALRDRGVRARG